MSESPRTSNRLRQLRAFCQAAQTGSVSKAGERLQLSQPSVSLLIKSLEEDLHAELFTRKGPRIELTQAGETLLEVALPLVEGMERLPEFFAAKMGNVNTGTLDIAAGESTILYLLPKYIQAFNQQYNQVSIHLHNETGRDGMALLRAGEVDFAVGSMFEVPSDITYTPTFTYRPMLITAKDHPLSRKKRVTLEDVSQFGLILPPRHLSTWSIVNMVFQQHGLQYKVILEAGGWEVVKKYVALGMGISVVTEICLTDCDHLVAIPLDQYFPSRSYGVVALKNKFFTPQARAFIEMLDPEFFDRRTAAPTAPQPILAAVEG
ncbi:MAG: LysR family transcriptional regulator [Thiotrichales bacterium]